MTAVKTNRRANHCVLALLFLVFIMEPATAQERNRLTWPQWSEAMEELHNLSLWEVPPFEGDTEADAIRDIANLDLNAEVRLAALGVLRPVMQDDGTAAFETIRRLVTNVDLEETYRYQLITSLSLDRPTESLIATLVKDPRYGDGKFKAGYIMRLLDVRLASQSPPGEDAFDAVRSVLNDDRAIVRAAAVRYLGSEDPASELILITELRKLDGCSLPTRMLLELSDPTKDQIMDVLLPYLTFGDKDVRMEAATRIAINRKSHATLWSLVLNPETRSEMSTAILGELADYQPSNEFMASAIVAARAQGIPSQVRLRAVSELGSLLNLQQADQNMIEQQREQFESLLQELQDSDVAPKELKEGINQLHVPAASNSTGTGANRADFDRLQAVVVDSRAPLRDRHAALLDLRKGHPQFYQVALDAAEAEGDPEFRAIAFRAIALGLKDGRLDEQQKMSLAATLRDSAGRSLPDSLKNAVKEIEKHRDLLPKSDE